VEAGGGGRRRLEEEVDDDLALEVAALLAAALADLDELLGRVENGFDFRPAQLLQAEQVTAGPDDGLRFADGELRTAHETPSGQRRGRRASFPQDRGPASCKCRISPTAMADKETRRQGDKETGRGG